MLYLICQLFGLNTLLLFSTIQLVTNEHNSGVGFFVIGVEVQPAADVV